jgi:hypothetical protein
LESVLANNRPGAKDALTSGCQTETHMKRIARKARKIRYKLDIDNPIFGPDNLTNWIYYKPKNMHWKTFDRLKAAENQAQESITD